MAKLYELAVLAISLIVVGAAMVAPGIATEERVAIIAAILAGLLIVGLTRRP